MKRKVTLLVVAMLLPFLNGTAQSDYPECLFDTVLQKHLNQNPEFARTLQSFPYGVRQFRAENPHLKPYPKPMPAPACEMCMTIDPTCFKTKYALPVLVHIVHLPADNTIGTGSNISNNHVYQAIASLNKKFAGYGEPNPAVNTGIQFFLAPEGQDNNGIFRYANAMSNHSYTDESALYHLIDSQYRNGKYINIFVINQLIYPSDVGGYASMPGMPYDMVVVARKQFGDYNACTGCDLFNTSTGKTTAHEMGHYLGLYHTHNKGCDMQRPCDIGGDEICDTRPSNDKNANNCTDTSTCVSFPLLKENIMSYTPQSCAKYFTFNQMERMHYTLEYKRPDLISISWLTALNPDICLFSARFALAGNIVCDTGTVSFTALPYTTTGVTYRWTLFDTAQNIVLDTFRPDTPTLALILTSASTPHGFYDVRLQVIYDSDTATEYMSQAIWVTDCQATLPHEGGNWFFGRFAGLLFSESGVRPSLDAYEPVSGFSTINSYEGCISLSDSMGNLLFYGGGFQHNTSEGRVFNSIHAPINNNYPLAISGNCAQNSVAFPCPFDTGKMIILQNNATVKGKLSYTLLKKSVDGLYVLDTATVNTPILIPEINSGDSLIVGESLTAAPKCNGQGYWVAITVLQNGDSLGYLTILSVDNNGIHLADIILLYKTFYSSNHTIGLSDAHGYAKFSPDGTHLAIGKRVFSFDRITGKLTKKYTLPVASPKDSYTWDSANFDVYGLSFSSNSRYLYWIGEDSVTREANIQRMDLSLANPVSHIQVIGLHPANDYFHAMQLGPDGKLYIANEGSKKIGVIHFPDKEWDNTNNPLGYDPYGVPLQIGNTGGTSSYGLPNMIDALRPHLVKDTIYYTIKDCRTVVFSTPACCRSNYLWIFGDGDTSQQKETEHTYSHADVYHVKLVLDGTDTLTVQIPLFSPRVTLRGPHELCNENQYETYDAIDIDSFSSQYQLLWEVKDGSYSPDPSTPDGILPMFDFLPAQIKVTVYDPLNQCTASDSFTVGYISSLIGNKINYGIPKISLCPTANSFSISGTTPVADTIFNYAWYYSLNNEDWFEMTGEDEKDLSTQPAVEKTTYFKRLLYPDECDNWSNVVKVLPVIQHNDIFMLVPLVDQRVCHPNLGGTLITSLRSDTVIAYDDPQQYYYFKWQQSPNGYAWTDIEPYNSSVGHGGYDWWYSPRSLERRFADHEPYQFIRKIVTFSNSSISCYDTSNVVKIVNYNIDSMKEIRFHAYDPDIIHGVTPIEPDSLFNVIWQSSCNGFDWTDIEAGFNQDTLWNVQLHSGRFIRRKIIKLSYKGEEYCDSLFSNQLELNYFSKQPSVQSAQIGEIALINMEFTSTQTYSVQWQKYDSLNQVWVDLEGETDVTLSVEVEKCNLNTLYRAKIISDCGSLYSDSVWVQNSFVNSDFFLWMKDIPSDTAAEPHAKLKDYFISPDISASNSVMTSYRWGISYQILNKEVDLYVRVHNKGGDTSRGGKLYLYASLAGLNPEWDFHFTDKFRGVSIGPGLVLTNQIINPNPPFNFQTLGSPINFDGIAIPSIPPNGDTVLHYRWTNVPDQFVDYQLRLGGMNYTPSKRTILYYARIEECSESPFDMTIAEEWFNPPNLVQTAKHNIKNNARIAALNSHILPVGDVFVSPGNPEIVTDIFALDKVKMVVTSESTIANDIEMIVYFDDTLWAAFQSGGFVGHGYTLLQDGIFRVDSFNNVYWDNIDLGINSVGHAGFSLHYKAGADSSGNAVDAAFKVTLFEDNTEKGSFYLNTNYRLPGLTMASIMPKTNKKSLNKSNISDIKDGSEETLLSTNHTDLTSKRSFEMRVYPNPFSNELKVYVGEYEQDAKIMLHDLNGKVLFNQPISNNTQASGYQIGISTLGFAEGIYFIQYVSGNRQIVKKVVLIR